MTGHAYTTSSPGRIVATGIAKSYRSGRHLEAVVKDCALCVEPGELTAIIGPSGCGKSTLLRLIAGFDRPTEGDITLDGKPVTGPGRDRLVVFQETALFPWMKIYDNIMYGPRACGEDTSATRSRAEALLDKMRLSSFANKYPRHLSGGMQRLAELARAMINNPKVMILDEPFRGLDAMTKELMWEYYSALYDENRITSLFATTDIDEALFLADRILVTTNRPARVREVLEVDVPRPRRVADLVENDRFNEIKMRALSILHDEAMKSFAQGSKGAAELIDSYGKQKA